MSRGLFTAGNDVGGLSDFEQALYNEWVEVETHDSYNNKTTVVVMKLKNGFEIVGTAGCEDPKQFSEELGRIYALKDALNKLGEFATFYRAQVKHLGGMTEVRQMKDLPPEAIKEIRKAVAESMVQVMRDPMLRML